MSDEAPYPSVSVVVPVYKVEKYLRACVESVLAQSFRDFELILVDDGSPDKCGEICDELAKQDPRVRVFHQQNGGVTSARRLGVEQARGEWITFVDSDDLLPPNALKDLFDEATDDVDWVQGERLYFMDGELPNTETRMGDLKSLDLIGLVENMLQSYPWPWGKLVRGKLFSPHVFEIPREMRTGEDVLMNFRLLANGPRRAKEIGKVVYCYRLLENSVYHSCVMTENYIFRYAKLLLNEMRKISTPSNRERLATALSVHLCGVVARLVGHGLPIKFPHRLATLIRRGAKETPRDFFIYLCLRFECPGVASAVSRTYHFLRWREFLDARGKTLLE